jgi:hypothetical protein
LCERGFSERGDTTGGGRGGRNLEQLEGGKEGRTEGGTAEGRERKEYIQRTRVGKWGERWGGEAK